MISLFFVAFIWIIVFILICYNWYQDDGVLFFLDLNRIGMMIWSLGTGLYDFALSDLYHPSLLINAVSLIVFVTLIIDFIRTPPTFIRTCADECGNPIP